MQKPVRQSASITRAAAVFVIGTLLMAALPLQASAQPGSIHVVIQTASGRTTFPTTEPIQFGHMIDAQDCAALDRLWDFGDGGSSTEMAPVHTYASPGNYHVTLTVTSTCEKARTAQLELKLRERGPVAVLVATPDPTRAGEVVLFDASASSAPVGSTYRFAVDGQTLAEQPTPTLEWTFTVAGPHAATVTVTAPHDDPKHSDYNGNHYGHLGGGVSTASTTVGVIAGPAARVLLSPATATTGPGGTVAFGASAFDAYGNVVDVAPTWEATCGQIGADGVFVAPTSTGACIVSADVDGVRGVGFLVVRPGPLASLVIEPPAVALPPGGVSTFTARGADEYGNPVPVSPTWGSSCGEIDASGVYVAPASSAQCTVSASEGDVGADADVVVEPLPTYLATILVDGPATLVAGSTGAYHATGLDENGDPYALASPDFTVDAPTSVGTFSVCHSEEGVTGCVDVSVVPDALARLDVEPATVTIVAGGAQTFTARGFDRFGNEVPVSPAFSAARGAFEDAAYRAPVLAGSDSVLAEQDGVQGNAVVTVVPDALHRLVVSGPTRVTVGTVVDYEVLGYDVHGNRVSVEPAWTTDVGSIDEAGTLTAATLVGSGTVAAASDSVRDELPVTLVPGPIGLIVVDPEEATTNLGQPVVFGATAYDAYGNLIEDATFSWTTTLGTITETGLFNADQPGDATVAAHSGGAMGIARALVRDILIVRITMEQARYDPVDAIFTGPRGTVEVFLVDGTPLPGASVTIWSDHNLAGIGMTRLPFDDIIRGETDGEGKLRFRVTLQGTLPGEHQLVASAAWGANTGVDSESYSVMGPA